MTAADLARTHASAFGAAAWSDSSFSEFLKMPFHHVIGDENCFALIKIIGDEAEILTLATHRDVQRQGRARALISRLFLQCQAQGVTQIFLEVDAANTAARALYEQSGFTVFATRPRYYGNGNDATCMKIMLT